MTLIVRRIVLMEAECCVNECGVYCFSTPVRGFDKVGRRFNEGHVVLIFTEFCLVSANLVRM